MKRSIVIAACSLACVATSAFAQVGSFGAVGSLGASGAVSNIGGLGSGIASGARVDGLNARTGASTGNTVSTPATAASGSTSTGAAVSGSGISTSNTNGVSTSTQTPIVAGSAWGSTSSSVQATTPDLDSTKRDVKNGAKNKVDRIEDRGDKTIDRL